MEKNEDYNDFALGFFIGLICAVFIVIAFIYLKPVISL